MRAILFLVAMTGAFSVDAVPITYTYLGPDFATPLPAGFPAGVTGISSTFTVDLPGNAVDLVALITDWSISDGATTITAANADFLAANFYTDASGAITGYYLRTGHPDIFSTPLGENAAMSFIGGTFGVADEETGYCTIFSAGMCQRIVFVTNDSGGTLTPVSATQVPEPSTLTLLGAGLFGFAFLRRRRTA